MRDEQSQTRVMIVDDSAVIRGLVSRWIEETPGLTVVASHANGRAAVADITVSQPDVVILDIEMPEMDGLTALPLMLKQKPGLIVLVSSTLTRRGAEVSLKALSLGATDYIAKPDATGRVASAADYRRELTEKVVQLGRRVRGLSSRPVMSSLTPPASSGSERRPVEPPPRRSNVGEPVLRSYSHMPPRVLAIGSSTGGPQALMAVLSSSKEALGRVPVLIVQHMPPTFTALLAEQLGKASGLASAEAKDGERLEAGRVYVAPGGKHLVIEKSDGDVVARLLDTEPVNFCKPAVDPMFRSVSEVYGAATLSVVLTGMGSDGAAGAKVIAAAGGSVIAQDEATSVVWGMPGATAATGACSGILPLPQIGPKIKSILGGRG